MIWTPLGGNMTLDHINYTLSFLCEWNHYASVLTAKISNILIVNSVWQVVLVMYYNEYGCCKFCDHLLYQNENLYVELLDIFVGQRSNIVIEK